MINKRREFFRVTLDEIKKVVRANFDKTVEFIDYPQADQYRASLQIINNIKRPYTQDEAVTHSALN